MFVLQVVIVFVVCVSDCAGRCLLVDLGIVDNRRQPLKFVNLCRVFCAFAVSVVLVLLPS